MDMKTYLTIIISLIILSPLDVNSYEGRKDYYSQLKLIESVRLDDISHASNQLQNLSQYESEFNEQEQDLYLLLKAHSNAMFSEFDSAKKTLTKLSQQSKSIDIRARAYSILAAIENIQGNNVDAFVALDNSLSQLSEVDDQIYRLDILQNAVSVYKESELIEYALELSRRHLTEANRSRKMEPMCHANYELASIEIMAQKTRMAEERLKSSRLYCEKNNEKLVLLEIDASIAEIAIIEHQYQKALSIMNELFPKVDAFGWDILTARSLLIYAEIYLNLGEIDKAKEYALESYELSSSISDKKRILSSTAILAKIYSEDGNNEDAIKYYKEYMELNNEHLNKIRQRKLAFQTAKARTNSNSLGSSR